MNEAIEVSVKCADFLRDNRHLYAHKARRKKIALISIEVVNRHSAGIRIELGATMLVAGGQSRGVEPSANIIRKFTEFTWDFVLFAILAFDPMLVAVDVFFLLSGPLYNRRLKKQLRLLSDGELFLEPGECKQAILGFRGVSEAAGQLQLSYRLAEAERQSIQCEIC